ncbi:MAG: hypothetical protein JWN43_4448 [Gammaproteobacteria bacterium]|nr:hypothetical protein [Gammaproteobacteria bacterium]
MVIDYTITIGNIIEIGSIIGGGLAVLWTLKADVNTLKSGAETLKNNLAAMQAEIKKLGDILVSLADMRGEIKVLNTRVTAAEQDIRELQHGDGFVKGPRGVDREYP